MQKKSEVQFDFLKQFIEHALDEAGFQNLTEETRGQYVPQFVAEAERRIGLALIPRLTEDSAKELEQLLEKDDLTPEEMRNFWTDTIPDFENVVGDTLRSFSQELKDTLNELSH